MNNIQEDDWSDDTWSRHSGMPNNEYSVTLEKDADRSDIENNLQKEIEFK